MSLIPLSILVVFVYMTCGFLLALVTKRNDIVDPMWGLGFLLITVLAFVVGDMRGLSHILVLVLVALWALRLSVRLYIRTHGKQEDYRYAAWRQEWMKKGFGYFAARSFLQVFMLQGLFMLIIAVPLVMIQMYEPAWSPVLLYIGLAVWVVGFFFEAVGDWQLDQFLKNKENKGKILQSGLWKYTRHPNYFGESVMWWGIWLIVLSIGSIGFVSIVSPILITFLITQVSGIPMLEAQWKDNKEFQEYAKRTSAFIPLPPKHS